MGLHMVRDVYVCVGVKTAPPNALIGLCLY